MKKQIFIYFSLVFAAGLTAYGFISDPTVKVVSNDHEKTCKSFVPFSAPDFADMKTEFFYDMGPRFRPIKKSLLQNDLSVSDFLDRSELERFDTFHRLSVIKLHRDYSTERRIDAAGSEFSEDQLEMLRSLNYSDSFYIKAYYSGKNKVTGESEVDYFSPHFTVAPEKSAEYFEGKTALLDYFRVNNERYTESLDRDRLMPAKLYFTVSQSGEIENVHLENTCGFEQVDEWMIKLAENLPGKWKVATNETGEKVDQELVISYGLVGC